MPGNRKVSGSRKGVGYVLGALCGRLRDGASAVRVYGPGVIGPWVSRPVLGLSGLGAACDGFRVGPFGPEIKPVERLVPVSFTHCCASTPGLSTWWSSTALKRDLVSRGASRLDAFSGYPVRTWLPGGAAGATTGTPEVRPPRSSRTRGSSSQVSYTHGR